MFVLTRSNAALYLLERGLLPLRDLVDGEIQVIDASVRNRNFLVLAARDRPGWFLKQPRPDGSFETLEREAVCYRLAAVRPRLAEVLPRLLDHSPSRAILTVERVPGESVWEHSLRTGAFPETLAAEVGRKLALCHDELGKALRFGAGSPRPAFPAKTPPMHQPAGFDRFASPAQTAAQAQVVEALLASRELCKNIEELAAGWQLNALIHGDMKLQNCLCARADGADGDGGWQVRIVDWESADIGDAAWDVAGVLQSYLTLWIESMRPAPGSTAAEAAATASLPLAAMQPSIAAFWHGYAAEMGLEKAEARDLLDRSVRSCGLRLLQTAFEHARSTPRLSARGLLEIQTGANVLARPREALRHLLGLASDAA
ncbi:MAG TPA: aminoglycoside phosphotransferase family protein [Thermoanaerobaculia bacterium]|nr:aminoglycoside phosphotransferase family protein [Thermoanaerobaculia bacterium]